MSKYLILLPVFVSGCMSMDLDDVNCLKIGEFAHSIAQFRDVGMTYNEIDMLTQVPVASYLPAKRIAYDVFLSKDSPRASAIKYQAQCQAYGSYHEMLRHMSEHYPKTTLKISTDLSPVGVKKHETQYMLKLTKELQK